jgi:hypothetical protein
MADEVFNLLNSPKKLKQFKKKTVNWSKNFSWKKSAKLSLDLIEKIVENYERI